MNWDEANRKLEYRWAQGDKIYAYVVSTDATPVVKEIDAVTLTADQVATDGKTAHFSLTVPEEVHNNTAFKLYLSLVPLKLAQGVSYLYTNDRLIFDTKQSLNNYIYFAPIDQVKRVARWGSIDIDPNNEQPSYDVNFASNASFVLMKVKNNFGEAKTADQIAIKTNTSFRTKSEVVVVDNINYSSSAVQSHGDEENFNAIKSISVPSDSYVTVVAPFVPSGQIKKIAIEIQSTAMGYNYPGETVTIDKSTSPITPALGKFYKLPNLNCASDYPAFE